MTDFVDPLEEPLDLDRDPNRPRSQSPSPEIDDDWIEYDADGNEIAKDDASE
ncbi:hypothetical protein [Agromyces badenianii]|uniref:hypothetical protein n=1 Tax=Agromyces badenianii TaxID=2080742 RepID=UPI00143D928D|nr:hypothetical protein [Agromyces badenianii]